MLESSSQCKGFVFLSGFKTASAMLFRDEGNAYGASRLWPLHGKEHFWNRSPACGREHPHEMGSKNSEVCPHYTEPAHAHLTSQYTHTVPLEQTKLTFLGMNTQALWLSDKSLCYTSLEITFLEIPELTTAYNLYRCWYWVYALGACFWIPPWSWGHDQSPSSLSLRSGLLPEAVTKVSPKTQYWYVSYD